MTGLLRLVHAENASTAVSVIAEVATERIRLLHQRRAGDDFEDFPVSSLFFMSFGALPRTMTTGRTS